MDTHVRRRTTVTAAIRALVTTLLAAALVLCGGTAAFATKPMPFNGAYVVDSAGVLGSRAGEVTTAIDALANDHRLNLFVVYVDTFTGAASRDDWADETAILNGLGVNDILLAVATKDRLYQLSVDPSFPLSDDELAQVEQQATVPSLRASDWAGAAINTATALGEISAGQQLSAPVIVPADPNGSAGSSGTGQQQSDTNGTSNGLVGFIIVAIIVAAVVVLIVTLRRRTKRKAVDADKAAVAAQADLERQVGSALVQVDDAITASEQELGFAAAQFGDAATTEFQASLERAKAGLRESFGLKQQLDDSIPDTLEDRRTWSTRILELCGTAQHELASHSESFNRLRELEKNPQPALDAITAGLSALTPRIGAASATLAGLTQRYAPSALTTVAENPAHVAELVEFVSTTLADVAAKRASGTTDGLVTGIQQAQAALAQATDMVAAIETLQTSLQSASEALPGALAGANADIEAGTALAQNAGAPGAQSNLASALATLTASRDLATEHGAGNPVAAINDLTTASGPLDAILTAARETAENDARVRDQLDRGIGAVQSEITAIKEFVVSRRAGIDVNARTALAEAERYLGLAISGRATNQNQALNDLTSATQFAAQARAAATADVNQYQNAPQSAAPGIDSGAAVAALTGILGGFLGSSYGSSRQSGRGSSGWGGSGGSGWGGSGGSSSRGSSRSSSSRSSSSGGSGGSSRGGGSRSGGRRGGGGRF